MSSAPPPPNSLRGFPKGSKNSKNQEEKNRGKKIHPQGASNEIKEKAEWKERKQQANGFFYKPEEALANIAIFVIKLEAHERHFDMFSSILSDEFAIEQIDTDGILKGNLSQYDAVLFPGGSIFEVDKTLGQKGMEMVTRYISEGGGYLGICAGAFLGGADAYDGCDTKRKIVGAEVRFASGQGEAEVRKGPFIVCFYLSKVTISAFILTALKLTGQFHLRG